MRDALAGFAAGLLFGAGLGLSGMTIRPWSWVSST